MSSNRRRSHPNRDPTLLAHLRTLRGENYTNLECRQMAVAVVKKSGAHLWRSKPW